MLTTISLYIVQSYTSYQLVIKKNGIFKNEISVKHCFQKIKAKAAYT